NNIGKHSFGKIADLDQLPRQPIHALKVLFENNTLLVIKSFI
ncbi:23376_t:CDS:1, partial [Cetraspora pellucida]